LGFTFNWKDLPLSIGIAVLALIASMVASQLLSYAYSRATGQVLGAARRILNSDNRFYNLDSLRDDQPFLEELIVARS